MKTIKEALKERSNGIFLLFLSGVIATGVTLNSQKAESKDEQSLADNNPTLNDGQILGEENGDRNIAETTNDTEGINQNQGENSEDNQQEESEEQEENKIDEKKVRCNELDRLLKKYCGKNYNVKKCREYLLETKDLVNKDNQCKKSYKKYHFVPKNENKNEENTDSNTNNSDVKEEVTLTINYAGGKADDKYAVTINSGMTVMDAMRKAKENSSLAYDESKDWAGYIQEINGVREDLSKSIFWMLYYNGAMASEGASTLKIKSGDSIEWKYMEVVW